MKKSSHLAKLTRLGRRRFMGVSMLLGGTLFAGCGLEGVDPTGAIEGALGTNAVEAQLASSNVEGALGTNAVEAQLASSKAMLATRGLPLQIVSYSPAGKLDTPDSVSSAESEILDADAVVPMYDGLDAASFQLNTIKERMDAFEAGDNDQDVVTNIQTQVLPVIELGQQAMNVTWESNGRQFQSKLIYNQNGIVYDNVLSNLAFVEVEEVPAAELPPVPKSSAAEDGTSVAAQNQMRSTRFKNLTIKWAWGSTRGKVEMDHYVISCDGWRSFCDDGGQVNAWMSVGRAEGKTARNALKKPRISKLAWGYGWATPTASFNIKWNRGPLTFSVSTSGVGSMGKGSGIHPMY